MAAPWHSDCRLAPCGPLASPSPQEQGLDPAELCRPHCPSLSPPTHLHGRENEAPAWAPRGLSLFLSSFLPSLIHSSKPFTSGPDTKLALGIQQKAKPPHSLLQGAHGLSRKHSDTSDCCVTSTKSSLSEPRSLMPERTWVQCGQDSGVGQPRCKSKHTTTF